MNFSKLQPPHIKHTSIIHHEQKPNHTKTQELSDSNDEMSCLPLAHIVPSGTVISAGPLVPLAALIFRDIVCIMGSFNCSRHLQVEPSRSLVLHPPLSPHLSICLSLIHPSIPLSWSCHHAECVPGLERDGCCQAQGTGCSSGSINSPGPACDITCLRQDNHDESLQSKLHTEEQRAASTQSNCDSLLSSAFFSFSFFCLYIKRKDTKQWLRERDKCSKCSETYFEMPKEAAFKIGTLPTQRLFQKVGT